MTLGKKAYVAVAGLALSIAAVGGLGQFSRSASAGQGGRLDEGKNLLLQAAITFDQAIAEAQAAASGDLDEVDLEYYEGKLVFNVDVGDKDVKVGAGTGVVLNSTLSD